MKTQIGFIGVGNMGYAIIKGISESPLNEAVELFAFDTDKEKLKRTEALGVVSCGSEAEIAGKCKFVFLAVKPQGIEPVLDAVRDGMTDETVLVSIAAGIAAEYIKSKTRENAKVILVMPNTPLLLGEGASALAKAEPVTDDEFKLICDIFASCGIAVQIEKDKMKEVIAVNSSSPAFIYLFAKGFVEYGESVGISQEASKRLFAKALIGSAKMITDSRYSIDELIKMVSSPGGTTLAGLDELYKGELTQTVGNACRACTKRAYELSK